MAREKQFVTGENIDAKFIKINKVLNQLSRRATSVTGTIIMPQIPLVGGVQNVGEDGTILRFLLPLSGTIKKAFLHAEKVKSKTKPSMTITLISGGETKSTALTYKQGLTQLAPNLVVEAGTCVVLSTSDPDSVSGLSAGLVFEVAVSGVAKEQVALAAHLESVEVDDAGETTEGETT